MGFEFETSVEAANESGLEVCAVDNLFQVLLARNDKPDLALALVADHLRQGVEFADLVVRITYERAHLVDDENQMLNASAGWLLSIDPRDQLIGDALSRDHFMPKHVS